MTFQDVNSLNQSSSGTGRFPAPQTQSYATTVHPDAIYYQNFSSQSNLIYNPILSSPATPQTLKRSNPYEEYEFSQNKTHKISNNEEFVKPTLINFQNGFQNQIPANTVIKLQNIQTFNHHNITYTAMPMINTMMQPFQGYDFRNQTTYTTNSPLQSNNSTNLLSNCNLMPNPAISQLSSPAPNIIASPVNLANVQNIGNQFLVSQECPNNFVQYYPISSSMIPMLQNQNIIYIPISFATPQANPHAQNPHPVQTPNNISKTVTNSPKRIQEKAFTPLQPINFDEMVCSKQISLNTEDEEHKIPQVIPKPYTLHHQLNPSFQKITSLISKSYKSEQIRDIMSNIGSLISLEEILDECEGMPWILESVKILGDVEALKRKRNYKNWFIKKFLEDYVEKKETGRGRKAGKKINVDSTEHLVPCL